MNVFQFEYITNPDLKNIFLTIGDLGMFVYKLYSDTLNEINEGEMCRQWGRKQNSTFVKAMKESVTNNGPGCPCNHVQAVGDNRYKKHAGDENCLYTFEEGFYLGSYGTLVSDFPICEFV